MNQYMKILYNYILTSISNKDDVNDVLQETMLGIWQGIKGFKKTSTFKTWIIGISRNKINDFYRKHYNRNNFEVMEFGEIENKICVSNDIENIIDQVDIEKSLSTLPQIDRELLFLIFNAQLSYTEIQSITGIPQEVALDMAKNYMLSLKDVSKFVDK